MSRTRKQEREYTKRRLDKRAERERQRVAQRHQRLVVGFVIGAILVVALVITVIVLNRSSGPDDGAQSPPEAPGDAEPAAPLATTDPDLYDEPPDAADAQGRTWDVMVQTSQGEIGLELDGESAPQATANFLRLARDGFYDGTGCHRLLPTSLLQCGDPTGSGTGGPGYSFGPIENAPDDDLYPAGTLAMARQGGEGESMGSQFFLVFDDVPLPADEAGGYTVFGTITSGLDILAEVGAEGTDEGSEQPAIPVTIEGVTVS